MQANPKERRALGALINGALSCLPAKTSETNGVKLVAIRHQFPALLPANQLPLVLCVCMCVWGCEHDSAPGSPFITSHGTSFPTSIVWFVPCFVSCLSERLCKIGHKSDFKIKNSLSFISSPQLIRNWNLTCIVNVWLSVVGQGTDTREHQWTGQSVQVKYNFF